MTLVWFFAVVGYVGIGVVIAAINRRNAIDGETSALITVLWLPAVVLFGGGAIAFVALSLASYPFRWIYCQLANLESPGFLIGDDDGMTPELRATRPGTSLEVK